MSDEAVELNEDPELDLDHDGTAAEAVDEEPAPLSDEEMLVIDPGPGGGG